MILLCNQDGLRIDAFLAGEVDGLSRQRCTAAAGKRPGFRQRRAGKEEL